MKAILAKKIRVIIFTTAIMIFFATYFVTNVFGQEVVAEPENADNNKEAISTEKSIEVELFETQKELDKAINNKKEIATIVEEAIEEQKNYSINIVDLANQIRKREFEISKSEKRLKGLTAEEKALREEFSDKKHKLVDLLVGLQKINQNKPPALLVNPDDILTAVRNAMIISNIVPDTENQTRILANKLKRLTNIKNEMLIEKKQYESHIKALQKKHEDIEKLIDEKRDNIALNQKRLENENFKIDILSSASVGLQDLVLKSKRAEINRKKEYTHWLGIHNKDSGNNGNEPSRFKNENKKAVISALAQTYLKPEIPFAKTKGKLPFPVIGDVVSLFGEEDGFGSISNGIYVTTKNYAQVISPASGWVEYSGEFKNYGKLLIINVGDGYHIILAGMNILDVYVGQFIFSGEPVGVMGERAFKSSSMGLSVENNNPILYIEIRRNGKSLNPNEWWREELRAF